MRPHNDFLAWKAREAVTAHNQLADSAIEDVADKLQTAARTRQPIAPVREMLGVDNIDAAYAVQRELIDRRVAEGAVIVGRKIGLTSPAVQRQLGVDQPDFGVLLADMNVSGTGSVPSQWLLQPKVEAEIAFVLNADIVGDFDDIEHIRGAVAYAVAALEIVDSRISNWDITIADTIADNASAGLFILGSRRLTLDEFEPREARMRMYVDDLLVSHGDGSACLGDPLNALAWLARAAAAYGEPLLAGQIVLSGALGPMVGTPPGTRIHTEIAPLGPISAHFSSPEDS